MDIPPLSEEEAMSNIAETDTLYGTLQKACWALSIIAEHRTQKARAADYARRTRLFCLEDGSLQELAEYIFTPETRLTRHSIHASNLEHGIEIGKVIKVNFGA